MKIYTKTGDFGTSSLYNGDRIPKTDIVFDYLGDFDELNSHLGLLNSFYKRYKDPNEYYNPPGAGAVFYKTEKCLDSGKYYEWFILADIITGIQCKLMDISTIIATPIDTVDNWNIKNNFEYLNITYIENLIDRLESLLPKITNFVVPSGNVLISQTHVCRVLSRKCERNFLKMFVDSDNENINNVKIFLNRLSDLLFVISRFICMTLKIDEDLYSKTKGVFSKIIPNIIIDKD
jgi:cob(I)alamin adenosyltransferase